MVFITSIESELTYHGLGDLVELWGGGKVTDIKDCGIKYEVYVTQKWGFLTPDIWGQSDAHRETTALSWDTHPISHSNSI